MGNPLPWRRIRFAVLAALVLAAIYPGVTYGQALSAPGQAGVGVRTVDWLRSMGAGGVVDSVENWWYIHNVPGAGPPSPSALPTRPPSAPASGPAVPPPLPALAAAPPLPGEGQWTAHAGGALFTSYLRPDPRHASVIAGVARWDQRRTTLALHPGTQDPRGAARWGAPDVTPAERGALLATFNSGFLMKDTLGGWYADGHVARPLRAGAASLVISRDGTAVVGQWGRDVSMGPDVVAVRQNLDLIVDHGQPVPGLAANPGSRFGNPRSQFQYTWRSGIGTDSAGHLIYVAGNQLTLTTLAAALHDAGAVRAMALDMHPPMVGFNVYPAGAGTGPPAKLLPAMHSPATRYLHADQRDFFVLTLRPAQP